MFKDRDTQRFRGVVIATFKKPQEAATALEKLHGSVLDNRTVRRPRPRCLVVVCSAALRCAVPSHAHTYMPVVVFFPPPPNPQPPIPTTTTPK